MSDPSNPHDPSGAFALYFTFTSTGITLADGVTNKNWTNTFETEGQSKLAGFFGENVSLACGVANLNGAFEATYTCAVVNRAVDGTWRVGNYGTVQSNNTPAFNENGEYTISGANQLVLFPNTATSTPFTYAVAVSNVTRTEAKTEIGISLTDGNYKLTVGYRAPTTGVPGAFSLGITTVVGQSDHAVYLTEDDFGEAVTLKYVVTKESIQFYCNKKLIFSFMKDSFTSNIGNPAWTSNILITNNNSVTDAYKTRIAGFFAENASIAVGINSGLNTGSATATYRCSITKN